MYDTNSTEAEVQSMRSQDAIDVFLKYRRSNAKPYLIKARELAIAALKRDIEQTPLYHPHPTIAIMLYNCPVCQNPIWEEQPYCEMCGQKMNWKGELE